jgi:uncharacterized protein
VWHDIFSDPSKKGEVSALSERLLEQGVLHEQEYVKNLKYIEVKEKSLEAAFKRTIELMNSGTDLIYQGEIQYEVDGVLYRGRPDLLEKRSDQKSKFGNYYYAPIEIKSSKKIKKEQWMQLVIYAKILQELQGVDPKTVAIINRDHERIAFEIKEEHKEKTFSCVSSLLEIIKGKKPPLKLISTCKLSPWYSLCVEDPEKTNDIALLYRLDARAHTALRDTGINTVADASNMSVDDLPKIPYASEKKLRLVKLQAQSLIDGKLKWISKPSLPETELNIYFDIEGDPLLQVQYLWGFLVVGDPEGKYSKIGKVRKCDNGKYYIYFLAEHIEDEESMWREFLQWVEILPKDNLTIFHYHHYEVDQCNALRELYGGSDSLNKFIGNFVDLCKVVIESVIFPLYFYSIKDIAKSKFLNFKWRHAKAGGAQSIFWYEDWLEKGDKNVLNDIIDYNEDDVIATEFLHKWLIKNSE